MIDPFESAHRQAGVFVAVETDLVQALRPDWTIEQANRFLDRNAGAIAHAMLWAGEQALRHLLEQTDDC